MSTAADAAVAGLGSGAVHHTVVPVSTTNRCVVDVCKNTSTATCMRRERSFVLCTEDGKLTMNGYFYEALTRKKLPSPAIPTLLCGQNECGGAVLGLLTDIHAASKSSTSYSKTGEAVALLPTRLT